MNLRIEIICFIDIILLFCNLKIRQIKLNIKNVLIINGHPNADSFNYALAESYRKGAESDGGGIKFLNITELSFDAFQTNFKTNIAVEDIKRSQDLIKWAEHIVWVYPTWWYSMPALLKAFIEQTFLSGFGFNYIKSKYRVKWEKYLSGKTTSIISTMDAPPLYYKLIIKDPGHKMLKASMAYCGIKFKSRMYFGSLKVSTKEQRKKWLLKAENYGNKYN